VPKGVLTPLRLNALTFTCGVHVFTAGVVKLILRSSRLVPSRAAAPRIAIGVREDPREVNGASGYAVVIALTANVCAICATSFSGYSPVSPVFRCLTFEDRESGPYRAMSSGSAKRPKL
jgi:hypothetical protein